MKSTCAVLFDEPFSALDEITARKLRMLTQELWQARPRTGILVTHNTLEAAFLADRVETLGTGASHVVSDIPVDIPRPRSSEDLRSFEIHRRLLAQFSSRRRTLVLPEDDRVDAAFIVRKITRNG